MFGGYIPGGLGHCFGGYYPYGYGTWFGGGLTNILFLILIGVVIYLLVKQIRNVNFFKKHDTDPNNEALEIAKLRYVRGEITSDEYTEIVKMLKK
ncbi:Protein of unknown function DUF2078, membrane [Thermoanaerobacter ethanolicus JW 200]|uniref:Putative membrane protein n=1 Tax=Thermoanaerobacter siderophilus SR4 TaxID=880478 RepID=I9KTJ6_9THEO|nr:MULTISPECIES: hypothetical protein [Thermoanaerobacter]EGD51199.1 Protein of unknown function DUF2078, membrane [Thermoanaerobacter ethanolicus JW 200]EIW00166.1 putative membrane protein [Thermoanaerobacter siderophilus SR4]UZQ82957.1 hypothetical protein OEI98_002914 [Thermoanaerobacter sp. RKWS2]